MTDKMKTTIVGGLIGGVCLVLSTILPISISARKDRDLKAMEEKYEATIAVLQELTAPGPVESRSFFDVAKGLGGINIEKMTKGAILNLKDRNFLNGIYMTEEETEKYSLCTYEFTGSKGTYTQLEFFVGVINHTRTDNFSHGKLIITFDGTNDGEIFSLTGDMDTEFYQMPIPKEASTIQFEFVNEESGKRPAYGIGNICVR